MVALESRQGRKMSVVAAFCLCAMLSACGGSNSSIAPTQATTNVSGTWIGTGRSRVTASTFSARVVFAQSGSSLSGNWSATDATASNSGSLSGSIAGASLSIVLTPSDPRTCGFTVTTTASGPQMNGDYATRDCTVAENGSLSLNKQ